LLLTPTLPKTPASNIATLPLATPAPKLNTAPTKDQPNPLNCSTKFTPTKETKMTIERFHIGKRLSEVVVHSNTIYLAGQVADDKTADMRGQTRQILDSIDRLLAEVGSDKTKILNTTIYVRDMKDFAAMNEVWDAWVPAGNCPARATVEARMAAPEYLVEIQIIAAK
jgi:enamine deaminase RidA (YjgF/YER057c/UK114 family)